MPSPSAGTRAPRTSRRRACPRPDRPTAPRPPRATSVRSRVRQRRDGAVGREHDPAAVGLEPVVATSRASSGSWRKPRLKPVAQITCSAPFTSGRDPEPLRRPLERLVPLARRAGRRARAAGRAAPRALGRRRGVEAGEPAAREERPRHVERPARRLPPPHRGDLARRRRARSATRSPPPSRRRRRPRRRRTRAARRRGRPAGRPRAPPGRSARDGRWRRARGGTRRRSPSSSNPPSTARIRSTRRGTTALVPAVRAAQLLDVVEELADGRVVAVAHALHERPRVAPPERRADREPGEATSAGSARRSPSASAAGGSPRPGAATRRRVGARGVEDRHVVRLDAAVHERRVRDEAGQAAADDRARPRDGRVISPSRRAAPGRSSAGTRRRRPAARSAR